MKKILVLVSLLVSISGVAIAQDISPLRTEVGLALGLPVVAVEYAFPLGNMSMGIEAGFSTFIVESGAEVAVRWYPLNNRGQGLNLETAYTLLLSEGRKKHYGGAVVGYRFVFFKHLTLNIGLGYQYFYTPNDGILKDQVAERSGVNTRLTIGAAF